MGVHALGVIAAPALSLLAWQGTRRRLQQAPAPPAGLSSTGCSDCLIPSLCLSSSGRCLSVGRWWDGNCTASEDEQQRIPGAVVGLPGCWSPVSAWGAGQDQARGGSAGRAAGEQSSDPSRCWRRGGVKPGLCSRSTDAASASTTLPAPTASAALPSTTPAHGPPRTTTTPTSASVR